MSQEEAVKAVILTDNYSTSFEPLSFETPPALMPLCGIPIIEYTLQWLQINNFTEIIVLYTQNHKQLTQYFQKYQNKKLKITLSYAVGQNTTGGALRHLYESRLVEKTFLLCKGAMVSNIDIKDKIIDFQKKYRKENTNIMAAVYRKISSNDQLLSIKDDFAYVIDHNANSLMQIDSLQDSLQFILNRDRISTKQGHSQNFKIHLDLYDPEIYLCSIDVLKSFNERDQDECLQDMIKYMLTSEINEETITVYICQDNEYAAMIQNPRIFKIVQDDIINRYASPLNFEYMQNQYYGKIIFPCQDFNKYVAQDSEIAYSSVISNSSIIGKNTIVSENAKIKNSIIGNNVIIGKNVVINNSIIWDNVKINENCSIESGFICDNCELGKNSKIQKGVVLGYGSILKENAVIEQGVKVCTKSFLENLEFEEEKEAFENQVLKQVDILQENTYLYEVESKQSMQAHLYNNIGFKPVYLQEKRKDHQDLDQGEESESEDDQKQDHEIWRQQVGEIVRDTLRNPISIESEVNEIVDIKMYNQRQNIELEWEEIIAEISHHLWPHLLELEQQQKQEGNDVNLKRNLTDLLKIWMVVFKKLGPSTDFELNYAWIENFEFFCLDNQQYVPYFKVFITLLYQQESGEPQPFTGENLIRWSEMRADSTDPVYMEFYKQTKQFIDCLRQESSDSETESDSDEDNNNSSSSSDGEDNNNKNDNNKNNNDNESSSNSNSSDSDSDDNNNNQNKNESSSSSSSNSSKKSSRSNSSSD